MEGGYVKGQGQPTLVKYDLTIICFPLKFGLILVSASYFTNSACVVCVQLPRFYVPVNYTFVVKEGHKNAIKLSNRLEMAYLPSFPVSCICSCVEKYCPFQIMKKIHGFFKVNY